MNFTRLLCRAKRGMEWEAALFTYLSADRRQQVSKARKNYSF